MAAGNQKLSKTVQKDFLTGFQLLKTTLPDCLYDKVIKLSQ